MQKSIAKRGFTLVELLVVIAIIGILASFLMPALRRALFTARQLAELNNMKQVTLGIIMFSGDNENYLLPHGEAKEVCQFMDTRYPSNWHGPNWDWRPFAIEYSFMSATGSPLTGAPVWSDAGNTRSGWLDSTWTYYWTANYKSNPRRWSPEKLSRGKGSNVMIMSMLRLEPSGVHYGVDHSGESTVTTVGPTNSSYTVQEFLGPTGAHATFFDGSARHVKYHLLEKYNVAGYGHYYVPND